MSNLNMIYKAKVSNNTDNIEKFYIGMTEPTFKTRVGNHIRDFNNVVYRKSTDLSKYVWQLKDEGKSANVEYEIVRKVVGKPKGKYCRLCLCEKLEIIENLGRDGLLNSKSELISKCRHQNKYLLKSLARDIR